MIKEAFEYVNQLSAPQLHEVGGETWSTKPLSLVKVKPPRPEVLKFHTLTGLIGYLTSKLDTAVIPDSCIVHVVGPGAVEVFSKLDADEGRSAFAAAKPEPFGFPFGEYLRHEEFMVAAQCWFYPTQTRADLLRKLGIITAQEVRTSTDDGTTQSVSAKASTAFGDSVDVPNPVLLAPYRSFHEVEQVESPLIVRVKPGPQIMLAEADGGFWRLEALRRVSEYLKANLPGWTVLA